MSLWTLAPIGVALVVVWHEWRQRKLPWPREHEEIRERIRRGDPVSLDEGLTAIGASRADIVGIYIPHRPDEDGET